MNKKLFSYAALAEVWDSSIPKREQFSKILFPKLAKFVASVLPKGATICDFTPGDLRLDTLLMQKGYRVGIFSDEAQTELPENITKNTLFLGNDTIKYDCVLFFADIDPSFIKESSEDLQKIYNLLDKDGILIGTAYIQDEAEAKFFASTPFNDECGMFTLENLNGLLTTNYFQLTKMVRLWGSTTDVFIAKKMAEENIAKVESLQAVISNLRQAPIDIGPCRVSRKRYEELSSLVYKRDLTVSEQEEFLEFRFYQSFGYNLDLTNPITFNEKLNWLKIYYHNPLETICSDKANFPKFVLSKLPEFAEHCVAPLVIFHSIHEVTNEIYQSLPEQFYLKSNFGSGTQKVINRSATSFTYFKHLVKLFLNPQINHYYHSLETCYKDIEPAVLCEPVIEFQYKIEFFCFDGEPFIYWIIMNDKSQDMAINIYSMSGKRLPVRRPKYPNFDPDIKPEYFDQLVNVAKVLSSGFPHVRVDFYAAKNTWYFSEMTFFSGGGLTPFTAYEYDVIMGKKINLPR